MNIFRDQALCMLFEMAYNKENVNQCKQKILNLGGNFQVCYQTDPHQPLLVPESTIVGYPAAYRLYPEGEALVSQITSSNFKSANVKITPE